MERIVARRALLAAAVVGIVAQALFVGLAFGVNVVVATALVLAAAATLGRLAGRRPDPLRRLAPDRRRPRRGRDRPRSDDTLMFLDAVTPRRSSARPSPRSPGGSDAPVDAGDRRAGVGRAAVGHDRDPQVERDRPATRAGPAAAVALGAGSWRRPRPRARRAAAARLRPAVRLGRRHLRLVRRAPRRLAGRSGRSCRCGPASRSSSRGSWPACSRSRPGSARFRSLPTHTPPSPSQAPRRRCNHWARWSRRRHRPPQPRRAWAPSRRSRSSSRSTPVRVFVGSSSPTCSAGWTRWPPASLRPVCAAGVLRARRVAVLAGGLAGGSTRSPPTDPGVRGRPRARRADRDRSRLGRCSGCDLPGRLRLDRAAASTSSATIVWLAIGIGTRPCSSSTDRMRWLGHGWRSGRWRARRDQRVGPQRRRRAERRAAPRSVARAGRRPEGIDLAYALRLGHDAVPVARRGAPGAHGVRSAALLRRPRGAPADLAASDETGWPAWNLGRELGPGALARSCAAR